VVAGRSEPDNGVEVERGVEETGDDVDEERHEEEIDCSVWRGAWHLSVSRH
jgi:hypothetical protein